MNKNTKKNSNAKKIIMIAISSIAFIAIAYNIEVPGQASNVKSEESTTDITVTKDSDMIIAVKDISETATFYPAEIDGTKLEVIAVTTEDGTVRTAFNTCQVCYSSGRGYYEQEGDVLVCQNCGNRFTMNDVQVTKGGCNPVPITEEYKTVTEDTITISKDFLTQAIVIFENWK